MELKNASFQRLIFRPFQMIHSSSFLAHSLNLTPYGSELVLILELELAPIPYEERYYISNARLNTARLSDHDEFMFTPA